ncbi:MAG TPA: Spy/CpxP family protein refolding chaperone [Pyrinomonadaceae bacterium]|nr:Spy/CpxP family protein refolding chaperone [Pyrinomonadaceae bacterium]
MKKLGKIQTLAIAGLSAIALATPIALAQNTAGGDGGQRHGQWEGRGGDDAEGRRGGHFGGGMFRGINLTDDQKTRLQQLHQNFEQSTKPLREQLRAKHQELRQAESGTTFNEALATQKLTEAAAIEAKLMGAEFQLRQDSLAVLTPEQKAQLDQLKQQREQRREQFKARRSEGQSQQQ